MLILRDMNQSRTEEAKYREEIQRSFSDFRITSIKPLGEGWMSRAFLVNE